jgi:hypothetical protein
MGQQIKDLLVFEFLAKPKRATASYPSADEDYFASIK